MIDPNTIDFAKGDGLVPVVVQDAATLQVLTLAYMDRAALDETIASGEATFFSRSRGRLWRKGEESGHVQRVREIRLDCDGDAIVLQVEHRKVDFEEEGVDLGIRCGRGGAPEGVGGVSPAGRCQPGGASAAGVARRSSATSFFKARISAISSDVLPARTPPSISA